MRDINDTMRSSDHHIRELESPKCYMGSDKSRHCTLPKMYMKVRWRRDVKNPVLSHTSKMCLNCSVIVKTNQYG